MGTKSKRVIIDLRSPAAFKFGSIPGAKNVPFRSLLKELNEIADKKTRILFVEDDVAIARTAQTFAMQLGFLNVEASELRGRRRV